MKHIFIESLISTLENIQVKLSDVMKKYLFNLLTDHLALPITKQLCSHCGTLKSWAGFTVSAYLHETT